MTTESPKTTALTPEEWKQLVLLNTAQLSNYLQSIPGNVEGGSPGITAEHLSNIDAHTARGRGFMQAWGRSRLPGAPQAPQPQAEAPEAAKPNGEAKKGGWPKGRPRTRQAKAPTVAQ